MPWACPERCLEGCPGGRRPCQGGVGSTPSALNALRPALERTAEPIPCQHLGTGPLHTKHPAVHGQGGGSQRCPRWWQQQQTAAGSSTEPGTPGHCLLMLALTLSLSQQGPGNYTDTFKLLILLKIIPRSGCEAGPHTLPGCHVSLLPSAGTGQLRGHWHPGTQRLSSCLGH